MNNAYFLEKLIGNRLGDPISALLFTNDHIIFGTFIGLVSVYNLNNKNLIFLNKKDSENISDISINYNDNNLYIGVGDKEIKVYKINNLSNELPQIIDIYETKSKHNQKCDNTFIFLTPKSFFRIELPFIDENSIEISENEQEYELKYFNSTNENKKENSNYIGKLPMTNYSVPLDFDGNNFLWIEILKSKSRRICVANIHNIKEHNSLNKFELDKYNTIGHISFAKLLSNKRVFIVHSFNKCEIRDLDNNFSLLENFIHIGDEVYAFDILYEENGKIIKRYQENNNNINENIYIHILDKNLKGNYKDNKMESKLKIDYFSEDDIDKNNYLSIRTNQEKKKIHKNNIIIITLDINGNINLYHNKNEIILFNLYKLDSIPQELKEKQFFSFGYQYYIRTNLNYFCISTDYGCFIIKKNNIYK